MKYFRFKTFTTSYYFPKLSSSFLYMYGLYSPYGGMLSKVYWALFRNIRLVRLLSSIDESKLDFPFLAKFWQKPRAMALTRNEVLVYRLLDGTGLTPRLLKSVDTEDYVYLKAEYINGIRPKSRNISHEILHLCLPLASRHLTEQRTDANGLKMGLSHGDFCPWNVLVSNDQIRLIDWELAADRTLGYDLFTYICQVAILFEPEKQLLLAIDDNMRYVKEYFSSFGITDYKPYLKAFAMQKWEYEEGKGNTRLSEKYKELANIF